MRADFLELGCPADVRLLVEARHQLDDDGDFLAVLRGADQRLHQHRIGAGAIDGHLDRDHLRVGGRAIEQVDHRREALVGMVQQDVAGADAVEDVAVAPGQRLRRPRLEGGEFQVVARNPVGHLHHAHEIDRTGDAVEVVLREVELREQEVGHRRRAVVGDFEADRVAEVPLRQFALDRRAQVLHFFLVDEEVAVARDAELVAAEHVHPGEQFADELVQDRGEEDEGIGAVAQLARQQDHARQHARRLHDGGVGTAPEGVLAFEFDGEVEALVEDAREGVRGVEPDRRQYRHHLAQEEAADPLALRLVPVRAAQEADAFGVERRQDFLVEQRVLRLDQGARFGADAQQVFLRRQAVGGDRLRAELDLFLESGDADLEELVQVAADDAQEAQSFEQRMARVLRLRQHAPVEREQPEFAVEEVFRGELQRGVALGEGVRRHGQEDR